MCVFYHCTSLKSLADALRRLRFLPYSVPKYILIKNTIYLIAIPKRIGLYIIEPSQIF
jgi:hypothetical protein